MKRNTNKLLNLALYNIKSINKILYVLAIIIIFSLEYYVRVINSVYSNKEAFDIFLNSFKTFNEMSLILIEIIICVYIIKINVDKKSVLIRISDYRTLLNANAVSILILNSIIITLFLIIMFIISLVAANFNIDIKYILKYMPKLRIILYFILIFFFALNFYGLFMSAIHKITKSKRITILIAFMYSFGNFLMPPFLKDTWVNFLFINYQINLSTNIVLNGNKMIRYYFKHIFYCFILFDIIMVLYIILNKYKVFAYKEKKFVKH